VSIPLRLAILSVVIGGIMGLLVLAAAMAAGHTRKLPFWLAGSAWGALTVGLLLTDCLHMRGPGPVSEAAFPVFFAGVAAWPVVLVWGQPHWMWRWLYAQLILLVTLGPAFLVAVLAAMCTFT